MATKHPIEYLGAAYKSNCPGCRNIVANREVHAIKCDALHRYAIQQHLEQPLRGGLHPPLVSLDSRFERGSR